MGVDYSTSIYLPNYNQWARPVTFYPIKSQPTVSSYVARGIFGTVGIDIISLDGSDVAEQKTILDILEVEFSILPIQQDQLYIGPDLPFGMKDTPGMFEVNETATNGGGETTLELRRILPANPP
jgi:hypothetical protein